MTRRRCDSCGRSWVTFGPHDPCPSCDRVQALEIGMDVLDPTVSYEPTMHDCMALLDGTQEVLPME